MKLQRLTFVLGAVACVAFAVWAGPAMAGSEVPLKGGFDGSTVPSGSPAVERFEVSGKATHLGKFTAVAEADLTGIHFTGDYDPDSGLPIAELPATVTFVAANGDELYADMDLVGGFHPTAQNFPSFTFTCEITGGTGRFDGATGSFSGAGGQTSVPGEDNDLIGGTFEGTISSVGSN